MARYLVPAVLVLSLAIGCSTAAGPVDLSAIQGWDIVVAPHASPCEFHAAKEFQRLYAQASGVELPLRRFDLAYATGIPASGPAAELPSHMPPDSKKHCVFIGEWAVSHLPACAEANAADLGDEGFRIVADADAIFIMGGGPRGTLYGVYTFVEDYLGVRFLAADHTHVPKIAGKLAIGPVDRWYRPPLEYRYSYYGENVRDPEFAVRLRNNAVRATPARAGGVAAVELINHSFAYQIPSSKYGKDHPEYYALVDGQRRSNVTNDGDGRGTQPCLTNPDVLRIVTKAVLDDLDKHPRKRNISVSQNDNRFYCRCENCRRLDEAEGSPMGTLLTFVNAVADEVAKTHPGVMVGTLSYQYTRRPPRTVKPRPNVQVQLCSIECCQIHAIDDANCPKNAAFCRDMDGWRNICRTIYVWSYDTNFRNYLLPCPNLQTLGPNVRYFATHNARGILMQGAWNARGAELSELRNYVASNLLWDPNRDGDRLTAEFLDLHYGKAAGPIRRFMSLCRDRAEAAGAHPRCNAPGADFGITDKLAAQGLKAFDEAMRLADDQIVRTRVEKASICAYGAAIEPVAYIKSRDELNDDLARRMRPLVKRFFELCDKHGVTMAAEHLSLADAGKTAKDLGLLED